MCIESIYRKVGCEIDALNWLKNILPCKQRTPYIIIVAKCGTIVERESSTKKFERANEGALQYVYKNKGTLCTKLLE